METPTAALGARYDPEFPFTASTRSTDRHEGTRYSYRVPRARVLNELTFAGLGKRIRVTVLERDDR